MWLAISSCLLGFVFVFGNSIRNLYEAVIFLFVVHPCALDAPCRQHVEAACTHARFRTSENINCVPCKTPEMTLGPGALGPLHPSQQLCALQV